jgi:hypothetical protein
MRRHRRVGKPHSAVFVVSGRFRGAALADGANGRGHRRRQHSENRLGRAGTRPANSFRSLEISTHTARTPDGTESRRAGVCATSYHHRSLTVAFELTDQPASGQRLDVSESVRVRRQCGNTDLRQDRCRHHAGPVTTMALITLPLRGSRIGARAHVHGCWLRLWCSALKVRTAVCDTRAATGASVRVPSSPPSFGPAFSALAADVKDTSGLPAAHVAV